MGLKNASFTMQRLIDRLLRGAHCFAGALLDDVIIYDNDFQLHLDHVRDIFDRLRSGGLTANGGKYTLGASCLRVLRHLVQDGSILPDEQAIANWPVPRTNAVKTISRTDIIFHRFHQRLCGHSPLPDRAATLTQTQIGPT